MARRVEGRYYVVEEWDSVVCQICPHLCSIAPSRSGTCGVRSNRHGALYVDNYGKVASTEVVDASTLPLYHFRPADRWLLVGMKGCVMRCPFCNTYRYSQTGGVQTSGVAPKTLIDRALEASAIGIAFGINEPAVSHEFVVDTFKLAREAGLQTFLQTCGSWNHEPFREVLEFTDTITFGFKGFDAETLTRECGGHLDRVRQNLEVARTLGVHVETTYLVIDEYPTWREQLAAFGKWLAGVDTRIPVILLRLEPAFTWTAKTSRETARQAHEELSHHLDFVYVDDEEMGLMNTHCTDCGRTLIRRGMVENLTPTEIEDSCPSCGARLPYVQ
ncbi:radical SAM protein [bacterium]|nr:radical SAM protein [bacterium]